MVADALIRIKEAHFSYEEAERVLKAVPVIPGDETIFEVFEEKEKDRWPEKATPNTMSSKAMKAVLHFYLCLDGCNYPVLAFSVNHSFINKEVVFVIQFLLFIYLIYHKKYPVI